MTRMDRSKIAEEWQGALINQTDFFKNALQEFIQQALQSEFRNFNGGPAFIRIMATCAGGSFCEGKF